MTFEAAPIDDTDGTSRLIHESSRLQAPRRVSHPPAAHAEKIRDPLLRDHELFRSGRIHRLQKPMRELVAHRMMPVASDDLIGNQ